MKRKIHNATKQCFLASFCIISISLSEIAMADDPSTSTRNYANQTFDSPQFKQIQSEQSSSNRGTVSAIAKKFASGIASRIPNGRRLTQDLSRRASKTTPEGEQVLKLIDSIPKQSAGDRANSLGQIYGYSKRAVPEALNFMGFAFDHGAFGAPTSAGKAQAYFTAAANSGYQPAIYNLAVMSAYGRSSQRNSQAALPLLVKANSYGKDNSGRICGLASYLAAKQNDGPTALKYASGCSSSLSSLAIAAFDTKQPIQARIRAARESLTTGSNEGFAIIDSIVPNNDQARFKCKYQLVHKYLYQNDISGISEDAKTCFNNGSKINKITLNQDIKGLAGFVYSEVIAIRRLRSAQHYHYSWTVPSFPFQQSDAIEYEKFVKH